MLRACGAVHLKPGDMDGGRSVIRVEHGKGGRDRNVTLPAQLPAVLRACRRLAGPEVRLFPGPGQDQTHRRSGSASGLPPGACRRRHRQAGKAAYASSWLCHPSSGERNQHPHHPSSARPQQSVHHRAPHESVQHLDPQHNQPARPADPGGGAAGLRMSRHGGGTGGGRYFSPSR